MSLDWPVIAGAMTALAVALVIVVLAIFYRRATEREAAARAALAVSQRNLAALRAALDHVAFGMVLLDQERRAQFINRAFRRIWRLPDDVADSKPSFVKLMYHERDARAYAV